MLWAAILLVVIVGSSVRQSSAAESKTAATAVAKVITLEALQHKVLVSGGSGVLRGSIAEAIGIANDVPYLGLGLWPDQTTDGMSHGARVLLEKSSDSETGKPLVLVFHTGQKSPGNAEQYWFRAALNGELRKASFYHGKLDGQGKSIKGSGSFTDKDVNSSEIKDRFKHEMDLWLQNIYLKKEWRSAEFSEGELKK